MAGRLRAEGDGPQAARWMTSSDASFKQQSADVLAHADRSPACTLRQNDSLLDIHLAHSGLAFELIQIDARHGGQHMPNTLTLLEACGVALPEQRVAAKRVTEHLAVPWSV